MPITAAPPQTSDVACLTEAYLQTQTKDSTRTSYASDLRAWSRWCDEHDVAPLAPSEMDVEAYTDHLNGNVAANTARRRLSGLRSFFDYLVDHGHLADNPAARARRPFIYRTSWTPSERRIDLAELDTDGWDSSSAALATLLSHQPVRLADIHDGDAHLDGFLLTVTAPDGTYTMPLAPAVAAAFQAAATDDGPLLAGLTGEQLSRAAFRRRFATHAGDGVTPRVVADSACARFLTGVPDAGARRRAMAVEVVPAVVIGDG